MTKILVIGDSFGMPRYARFINQVELSYEQTYPEQLRKLLNKNSTDVCLINHCIHANTAVYLKYEGINELDFITPDLVILQLGLADLWPAKSRNVIPRYEELVDKDPWVDIDEFTYNMEGFITKADRLKIPVIMLDILLKGYNGHNASLINERIKNYSNMMHKIARSYKNVVLIEYEKVYDEKFAPKIGSDGIHLTKEASRRLAEVIVEYWYEHQNGEHHEK